MNIKTSTTPDEQKELADFFDQSVQRRSQGGNIPEQADIRRATRSSRKSHSDEYIDPAMSEMLYGDFRGQYLDHVAHKSGGKVLELCCGPGWLALELGRLGQSVDAYDISNKAIFLEGS